MPEINADDLLGAVSAAVDESSPAPAATEDTGSEIETGDNDAPAGDETPEPELPSTDGGLPADGSAPEAETPPVEGDSVSGDAPADDRARDARGKFVKKEAAPDGKPAVKPEEKPDGKPAAKDPVNDPIPENWKKETKERFTAIREAVKVANTRADAMQGERDELLQIVMDTGSTPEQYSQALGYLKMVNSDDPAQIEKAITFLQSELSALSKMVGKAVPGVDLLAGHQDLIDGVANGTMTEEIANQLAGARERTKYQASTQQAAKAQTDQKQREEKEYADGRAALNAVGVKLKTDPQFTAKHAVLARVLKPALAAAHPSKWASIYETAYKDLEMPKAPTVRRDPNTPGVPNNQPLRGKTPSGGAKKEPSSLLDAINFGLEQAG